MNSEKWVESQSFSVHYFPSLVFPFGLRVFRVLRVPTLDLLPLIQFQQRRLLRGVLPGEASAERPPIIEWFPWWSANLVWIGGRRGLWPQPKGSGAAQAARCL